MRKTVTLPVSYAARLTAFGAGNLSEGIRYLVEFAYTRDGQPWLEAAAPVVPGPAAPRPGGPGGPPAGWRRPGQHGGGREEPSSPPANRVDVEQTSETR